MGAAGSPSGRINHSPRNIAHEILLRRNPGHNRRGVLRRPSGSAPRPRSGESRGVAVAAGPRGPFVGSSRNSAESQRLGEGTPAQAPPRRKPPDPACNLERLRGRALPGPGVHRLRHARASLKPAGGPTLGPAARWLAARRHMPRVPAPGSWGGNARARLPARFPEFREEPFGLIAEFRGKPTPPGGTPAHAPPRRKPPDPACNLERLRGRALPGSGVHRLRHARASLKPAGGPTLGPPARWLAARRHMPRVPAPGSRGGNARARLPARFPEFREGPFLACTALKVQPTAQPPRPNAGTLASSVRV